MTAYKLFKLRKNNTLGSLFINSSQIIRKNRWYRAYNYPTKGFAVRPGWHATETPEAPHLSPKGRVWAKVELEEVKELKVPKNHGGKWFLAKKMKVLEILC